MKKLLAKWLTDFWYQDMYLTAWFMPISMIYVDIIRLRRFLYRIGLFKKYRLPVPVVIVGNITVGGTGKTPLVIALVERLIEQGYQPGVISRGYSGQENVNVQIVTQDSDPALVGDEPLLLAKHCACPVAIGVNRVAAAKLILANYPCNVILSDDGLQHYALQRDLEIVVIDGQRRFGNGYCLPVGPLREPPERLNQVDMVVVNGGNDLEANQFAMICIGDDLINLQKGERKALSSFRNQACHALAAIGNPNRFFKQLESEGLQLTKHALPDHAALTEQDLLFADQKPVIMTEKDAVKCKGFAKAHYWYLPIKAALPETFYQQFFNLLKNKLHG